MRNVQVGVSSLQMVSKKDIKRLKQGEEEMRKRRERVEKWDESAELFGFTSGVRTFGLRVGR